MGELVDRAITRSPRPRWSAAFLETRRSQPRCRSAPGSARRPDSGERSRLGAQPSVALAPGGIVRV